MKTLRTIQTLSKIAKVISTIIFILCIVGFCGCIVGIIALALGVSSIKLGDLTLEGLISSKAGFALPALYAAMAGGTILCAGEAVLAKFSQHYFARELQEGTPFTLGGAKELLRLGILAICIPIATGFTASIIASILGSALGGSAPEISSSGSVSIGVMMILTSLICRYGAEITAPQSGGMR